MADTKLSALNELTTLSATDHLYVSPLVTGTRRDRRMTAANLILGVSRRQVRALSMSGDVTLDGNADYSQFLDPNGSDRLVTMISGAEVDGQTFSIQHSGSSNTLTIRNIATATILVLYVGWSAVLVYDATAAAWGVTALTLPTTHAHTGAAGDGAQISYNDLDNVPIATEVQPIFDDYINATYPNNSTSGIWYNEFSANAGITSSGSETAAAFKSLGVIIPYCELTGSYVSQRVSPVGLTFGYAAFDMEWKMHVAALSNVTNEYALWFGFGDSFGTLSEDGNVDGAYFCYRRTIDGDFITCVTRAASDADAVAPTNQTKTVTAVAPPTGAYAKFRIVANAAGTSIVFYIDGALVATHTTNIPTGSNKFGFGYNMSMSVGVALTAVYFDYFHCLIDASVGGR